MTRPVRYRGAMRIAVYSNGITIDGTPYPGAWVDDFTVYSTPLGKRRTRITLVTEDVDVTTSNSPLPAPVDF